MYVDLQALWDDGSQLAPTMLANSRHDVFVLRGASITVRVTVLANDGTPVPITAEDVAKLYVRRSARDGIYTLNKTGVRMPIDGVGRVDFSISPNDLKFVEPGRYLFDVWLTKGSVTNAVVPLSAFVIQPGLALPPFGG